MLGLYDAFISYWMRKFHLAIGLRKTHRNVYDEE